MPSTSTDRLNGLSTSVAIKPPCKVATTANITLSGEQTIDGVAVVSGDRVLVKDQTDATENGIYVVDTTAWDRAKDFDGNRDVVTGTMVLVRPASSSTLFYECTSANPIVIGTSEITFEATPQITPSSYIETLLDDPDAPTARTTLGAQSSSITASGTGGVARDVDDKLGDIINSADYGTLQQAITAAYGKKLYVTGTHAITSAITITDSIEIELDKDAVIDFSGAAAGAALNTAKAITITGSAAAAVTVSANVSAGATQITVSSTATFAAGDIVILRSDEEFMPGASGTPVDRGHITRVKSIDSGTTLTLAEASPFAYASASNARLEKITPISNVTISGGTLLGGGVGKAHNGIAATYVENFTVKGMYIDGFEDTGVQVSYGVNAKVRDCVVEDSTSPGGSIGNTGYGVVFYKGTRDSLIADNVFRRCRHAVSGGDEIISMYCEVRGNVAEDCGISTHALDCHEPCFWWTFRGNKVSGGAGGIVARGQYMIVSENTIQGVSGSGIRVRQFYTNTDGISGVVVSNNSLSGCASGGIILEGTASTQAAGFCVVKGNSIRSCGLYGIEGLYVKNVTISDNSIRILTSNTGTEGSAIRISGAASGDCSDVVISNNVISDTLRHGMRIEYVNGLVLNGNTIKNVSTSTGSAITLQECNDVSITGGQSYADRSGNGAVLSIDRCNRVTINGHRMKGNSANATQDGVRAFNGSGTSDGISMTGCLVDGCGRHAFFSSNTDRVLVTSNNVRDVTSGTKINISGAAVSVNADNITT